MMFATYIIRRELEFKISNERQINLKVEKYITEPGSFAQCTAGKPWDTKVCREKVYSQGGQARKQEICLPEGVGPRILMG